MSRWVKRDHIGHDTVTPPAFLWILDDFMLLLATANWVDLHLSEAQFACNNR